MIDRDFVCTFTDLLISSINVSVSLYVEDIMDYVVAYFIVNVGSHCDGNYCDDIDDNGVHIHGYRTYWGCFDNDWYDDDCDNIYDTCFHNTTYMLNIVLDTSHNFLLPIVII